MSFSAGRLRAAELLEVLCAVILVVVLFAAPWYRGAASGWQSLTVLRWLLLVVAVVAVLGAALTVTQRTPALPVLGGVATALLGSVAAVALAIRVLVHQPSGGLGGVRAGAVVGLAAGIGLALAGWMAIRDERPGRAVAGAEDEQGRSVVAEHRRRPAPPAGAASSEEDQQRVSDRDSQDPPGSPS